MTVSMTTAPKWNQAAIVFDVLGVQLEGLVRVAYLRGFVADAKRRTDVGIDELGQAAQAGARDRHEAGDGADLADQRRPGRADALAIRSE